jgi:hypothetical protein
MRPAFGIGSRLSLPGDQRGGTRDQRHFEEVASRGFRISGELHDGLEMLAILPSRFSGQKEIRRLRR